MTRYISPLATVVAFLSRIGHATTNFVKLHIAVQIYVNPLTEM